MAYKLSDIQASQSWKGQDVVKVLSKNPHFVLFNPGGGHSDQGWKLKDHPSVTGSIPLTSHGNLMAALRELVKVRDQYHIADS